MNDGCIHAIIGIPGSGKSLLLVKKIQQAYEDGYRELWTNCALNAAWWAKRYPKLKIEYLSNQEMSHYWTMSQEIKGDRLTYRPGIILAIDEIHAVYDALEFRDEKKSNPTIVLHWSTVRHDDDRVYLCTQKWTDILIFVRSRVAIQWYCISLFGMIFFVTSQNCSSGEVGGPRWYLSIIPSFLKLSAFRAYDTHGKAGQFKDGKPLPKPEKAANERKPPTTAGILFRWVVLLVALVLAFYIAFYKMFPNMTTTLLGQKAEATTPPSIVTRQAVSIPQPVEMYRVAVTQPGTRPATRPAEPQRKGTVLSIGGFLHVPDENDIVAISGDYVLQREPSGLLVYSKIIERDEFAAIREQRVFAARGADYSAGTPRKVEGKTGPTTNRGGFNPSGNVPGGNQSGGSTQPNRVSDGPPGLR